MNEFVIKNGLIVNGGTSTITGSLIAPSITGSLLGTASYVNISTLGGFIQGGNSFGTTGLLGTNDNQSLAIETSGSTRMFISSSGNVGIGTTTPLRNLDIFATNPEISTKIASTGVGKFSFISNINQEYGSISLNANSGEMKLYTGTSYFPTFYSSGNEIMRINTAGNIGIGTTSPSQKLDVNGNALIKTAFIGTITAFGDNYTAFSHTSRAGTSDYSLLSDNVGTTYLNASSSQAIKFRIDNTDKAILASNGNFGIGTSTPASTLNIGGSGTLASGLTFGSGVSGIWLLDNTTIGIKINNVDKFWFRATDFYPDASLSLDLGLSSRRWKGLYTQQITDNGSNVGIGTPSPSAKLDVNGNTIISGSLITSGSTGAGINTSTQYLIDTAGTSSLDWDNRILYDGNSTMSCFWQARMLYDQSGTDSLSWRNRQLYDLYTTQSIDWRTRNLLDPVGNNALSWRTRTLSSGGGLQSLNWSPDTYLTSNVYQQDIKSTATQDAVSLGAVSPDTYLGDIIEGVVSTVTPPVNGELCYLSTTGKWETYKQITSSGSYGQMVGLVFNVDGTGGTCQVLIEGHALVVDNGSSGEPFIENATYGAPVYIRSGSINGEMSTIIPSSGIVQVLGHCYYQNTTNTDYWMMKFKPSLDWVEL